eukprot:m.739008 g.739008  ORF g.739008 m.739008 type:complete len:165 (+) comp23101_c0_seq19:213-707(+)
MFVVQDFCCGICRCNSGRLAISLRTSFHLEPACVLWAREATRSPPCVETAIAHVYTTMRSFCGNETECGIQTQQVDADEVRKALERTQEQAERRKAAERAQEQAERRQAAKRAKQQDDNADGATLGTLAEQSRALAQAVATRRAGEAAEQRRRLSATDLNALAS